ncbi:hypothetical protein OIU78_022551 [Salix suchowensis]|nr:hypothetical protein OIU78_022551 [Salix suchowensis]
MHYFGHPFGSSVDINPGTLLDTCEFSSKAGIVDYKGNEVSCSTVTDLCTIPGSNVVAVAVQSLQGILLVSCDFGCSCYNCWICSLCVPIYVSVKDQWFEKSWYLWEKYR